MILCLSRRLVSVSVAAAMALLPIPSYAARSPAPNIPLIRDAEIEGLIEDSTRPLLEAAGLSQRGIEVVLVNNMQFNAFVSGRRIFVNTGTILGSDTPNELIGVLAHEIGHLAGGHQQRLRQQMEQAQRIAMIAGLLGMGIAAAGAVAGDSNVARAGTGVFSGGGAVAINGLRSYQRSEEITADGSALVYLQKTGQSGKGLIQSFEGLERDNLLSGVSPSRYITSHPAPRDRIARLETLAKQSPFFNKTDSPALQLRHDLARAKIAAYADGANAVRRLFRKDPRGLPATYGEAISAHLDDAPAVAIQKIDSLIAQQPNSPWFNEIRGEILMEAGRGKEAAAAFSKAVKLDGTNSGMLQANVGKAMVTTGDPAEMKKAIGLIKRGLEADPSNFEGYKFLAMAYGRSGDEAQAELATAEGYWQAGSILQARIFAARAQMKLKPKTPAWLRAQDIIDSK